jgi:hypothetical protein
VVEVWDKDLIEDDLIGEGFLNQIKVYSYSGSIEERPTWQNITSIIFNEGDSPLAGNSIWVKIIFLNSLKMFLVLNSRKGHRITNKCYYIQNYFYIFHSKKSQLWNISTHFLPGHKKFSFAFRQFLVTPIKNTLI